MFFAHVGKGIVNNLLIRKCCDLFPSETRAKTAPIPDPLPRKEWQPVRLSFTCNSDIDLFCYHSNNVSSCCNDDGILYVSGRSSH